MACQKTGQRQTSQWSETLLLWNYHTPLFSLIIVGQLPVASGHHSLYYSLLKAKRAGIKINCPFSHFTLLLNFFILMGMEKPQIIIGNFGGHYWAFLTKEFTKVWYQSIKRPSKSIQADTSANPRLTRKRYGVALPWGDVYTLASLADDVPQSNDPTAGIEFVISANPQHPSPLQINKKN